MEFNRLKLINVSKKFDNNIIADKINLKLDAGLYVIVGDNGCGKSSLLKIMMGLTLPDLGKVEIFNEDSVTISNHIKVKMGYVFANERSLYYKLTATENLRFIGRIYGLKTKELDSKIPLLLSEVGLTEEGKLVETFSTGMKKRLAFARAILHNPEILFLDEIFSGLDSDGCHQIMKIISEYVNLGKLVILVTHQKEYIPKDSVVYKLEDGVLNVVDN
ncbi:MAG: ABC transporter ATP-binding protein [Erysipelotrichaceae bacterium]